MDISELVGHYRRNRESYTSAQYNETQLRREHLDPLFTLLGWEGVCRNDRKWRSGHFCKVLIKDE